VLLAGGDGTRLRDLTLQIAGDPRPKQFCPIVGGKSLFSQTRARLAPLFPNDRQLFVLSRAHEKYYSEDLTNADHANAISQPLNRGTGVAIALALLHVLERDPHAVVGLFPCDHYYANDDAFRATVRSAAACANEHPESLILVGAEPECPEIEYGWIERGPVVSQSPAGPLSRVTRFWEKPALHQARTLLRQGCLWNTFVTVGLGATLLDLLCTQVPEAMLSIKRAVSDSALDAAYSCLPPVDFSKDILVHQSKKLLVLRDGGSGWADLGSPARVLQILTRHRIQPEWVGRYTSVHISSGKNAKRPLRPMSGA